MNRYSVETVVGEEVLAMKSSKVINQIRCALRYVSVASWGMLVVALILGMLGYLLTQIEAAGIALQNIGASMAAAAVFYFFKLFARSQELLSRCLQSS